MNDITKPPQTVPAGAPQVSAGEAPIPEVSSGPGGAQAVAPAPAGTIPAPLKAFSDRPESAKNKMFERLRQQAKGEKPAAPEAKPTPPAAEAEEKPTAPEAAAETPAEDDEDLMGEVKGKKEEKKPEAKAEETKPEAKPEEGKTKGEKVNPWRLVDEHKAARAALEKEVADLKKLMSNPEARKQELEEVEKLRKRSDELEKHIRLVDYQKSEEYQTKYEAPYMSQWKTSMKELKGVQVETENGAREITPDDMFQLVNMPLVKAKQLASELFGDFASDVMEQRNSIREKFEAREKALETAKTEGVEKHQATIRQMQEEQTKLSTELSKAYQSANEFAVKDPRHQEFLSEREGDEEGNELLRKGYQAIDEAFAKNPLTTPDLTMDQRVKMVKKHAAIRHKAAAYSRLVRDITLERQAHAATKARLAEYEKTVPGRGSEQKPAAPVIGKGSGMDAMKARLRAKARPVPA